MDIEGNRKYICQICGYVYDPKKGDIDTGIAPETRFQDLPTDWECPDCGAGLKEFSPI
ncbi:MAG: rubredoxin [Nitrospinota bacterium]|nr:rubredoxin [Nitrospinota bacterium]